MNYRAKPIAVEAEQFRPEVDAPWPANVYGTKVRYYLRKPYWEDAPLDSTDWIVVDGEVASVVSDKEFQRRYEPVE